MLCCKPTFSLCAFTCPAVVTVLHVGVVLFIIIAGLTQSNASNFTAGG